jgi:heme-degrading monooxygenase HmoA
VAVACALVAFAPARLRIQEFAMVVVIFRARLRPDADTTALERAGVRMVELASQMPGFVPYKDFSVADGEALTLVEFQDEPTLLAWRNHPEHLQVQEMARAATTSPNTASRSAGRPASTRLIASVAGATSQRPDRDAAAPAPGAPMTASGASPGSRRLPSCPKS